VQGVWGPCCSPGETPRLTSAPRLVARPTDRSAQEPATGLQRMRSVARLTGNPTLVGRTPAGDRYEARSTRFPTIPS
jgi:hypothetical protein